MSTFAPHSAIVRSPTRLRVLFTGPVLTGGTTTGNYTVESVDGVGVDPAVLEALAVGSDEIELVLSERLIGGGTYRLTVAGGMTSLLGDDIADDAQSGEPEITSGGDIIIDDSTAVSDETEILFYVGEPAQSPSLQVAHRDVLAEIYGEDIQWDGSDWVETAEGDLQGISGPDNAQDALIRRQLSEGLAWDDAYGLKPRRFVDGPDGELPTLVALAERQTLLDDRVIEATSEILGADATDPSINLIRTTALLIGNERASVTIPVKNA